MNFKQTIEHIDTAIFTVTEGTSIPTVTYKTCIQCKQVKPLSDFVSKKNHCKICQRARDQIMVAKYRMFNTSPEYVKPEFSLCGACQENIPSRYFNENPCRVKGLDGYCKYHRYFYTLKRKTKNIDNTNAMSRDEFFYLLDSDCDYCGSKNNIGVDRLDSNKGYQRDNCVACCSTCNYMKNNMTATEYREHCRKVACVAYDIA